MRSSTPVTMLLALLTALSPLSSPQDPVEPASTRLVVMVSVDQMIPEQFERLESRLEGGLGRLYREGTYYRDARLPYARTETGAGHVTYSTGCLPRHHGIVGNGFYDRGLGREQYCVEDQGARAVRSSGVHVSDGKRSPENLQRPTLGELLQGENAASRVVSISGKDRAAIGMAGRAQGLVLWWDKKGEGFESSDFYGRNLPGYVSEWNGNFAARLANWSWEPAMGLTEADWRRLGADADERDGERPIGRSGVTFPYPMPEDASPKTMAGFAYQTPLCDQLVAELAAIAVYEESLGADDDVDLLCLSFSGCDVVGHSHGPHSREVTDLLLRLDRELGKLFDHLDQAVGKGRWIASLTADHGVLPLPEYLLPRGVAARRVTPDEVKAFRGDLIAELSEALGGKVRHRSAPSGYNLDADDLGKIGVDPAVARQEAARIIRGLRGTHDWIEAAYSLEEIAAFGPRATGHELLLRNSFEPGRTADLVVIHRSQVLVGMSKGTSHGTLHDYDRRVPMILFGSGFEAGVSSEPVGSQDIVPTLLGRLGVEVDASFDGEDLLR